MSFDIIVETLAIMGFILLFYVYKSKEEDSFPAFSKLKQKYKEGQIGL